MPRTAMTPEAFDSTRSRLLAATTRIIATEGYGAFSMRRLGQEVGLSAGALYRYFATRQHVLVAFWHEALSEPSRRFADIAKADLPPLERIRRLLAAYADFALGDRDRFRVLFIENDLGAFADVSDREDLLAAYRIFAGCVDEAVAAGALGPLSADVAAHVLWGAVHGVLALSFTVADVDFGDVRALAGIAADAAIRGLQPVESPHAPL